MLWRFVLRIDFCKACVSTAELDTALKEYAELQEQAIEFDPDELMRDRLAIRPDKERSAVSRVQSAYGDRYQPFMMYDSKRDVSEMLGEETEPGLSGNAYGRRNPNTTNRNGDFRGGCVANFLRLLCALRL